MLSLADSSRDAWKFAPGCWGAGNVAASEVCASITARLASPVAFCVAWHGSIDVG